MAEENGHAVQYPQTPATRFYACRVCRTHIALSPDCLFCGYHRFIVFKNAVNLRTDNNPEHHIQSTLYTLANTSCSRCNMVLGLKIIQVRVPSDNLRRWAGNVGIPLSKLLFWNGNEMVEEADYVQYPQTPATRFYACRRCRTHIAFSPDCVSDRYDEYITFRNAVNLRTDNTPENHTLAIFFTLANTSCRGCNIVLGTEIVQVRYPDIDFYGRYIGDFKILLSKLLFWNGNEMIEAVAGE